MEIQDVRQIPEKHTHARDLSYSRLCYALLASGHALAISWNALFDLLLLLFREILAVALCCENLHRAINNVKVTWLIRDFPKKIASLYAYQTDNAKRNAKYIRITCT